MKIVLLLALVIYIAGFIGTLAINGQMPVTPALAWTRAALWPIWFCGGLRGAPMPMD